MPPHRFNVLASYGREINEVVFNHKNGYKYVLISLDSVLWYGAYSIVSNFIFRTMETDKLAKTTLVGGALAALAASACCLGPLVLVSLGIGGAWISNLTRLEPLRPVFIGVALLCMALAYRKIYRGPAAANNCAPGSVCALPQTNARNRILFWGVSLLVGIALAYPYFVTLLD